MSYYILEIELSYLINIYRNYLSHLLICSKFKPNYINVY